MDNCKAEGEQSKRWRLRLWWGRGASPSLPAGSWRYLHKAKGKERLGLPSRAGVESPAPVGDERGEGAVVLVGVQESVGLTWPQNEAGVRAWGVLLGTPPSYLPGLPWYQATPRSVMLSSGWIMAFHSTEGVCGPERFWGVEVLEGKARVKRVQNPR